MHETILETRMLLAEVERKRRDILVEIRQVRFLIAQIRQSREAMHVYYHPVAPFSENRESWTDQQEIDRE